MSTTPTPANGSDPLCAPGSSLMGKSTPDPSSKSSQMTFGDLLNTTCLLASPAGRSPSVLQAGLKTDPSGPAPAPASPSVPQEKDSPKPMRDISGQPSSASSTPSGRLQSSVSRLLQNRLSGGSMEYSLTWKERTTPAGRRICALRASKPPTSGKGCTGWPTPNTPSGGPNFKSTATHTGGMDLEGAATLTGWVSPTAQDGERGNLPPRPQDTGIPLSQQVAMAGWTTPQAHDATGRSATPKDKHGTKHGCACLALDAQLTGWPTASTRDAKGGYEGGRIRNGKISTDTLDVTAQLTTGPTTPSSPAATEKRVASRALNANFSAWVMGFPTSWMLCGIRAFLTLKSQKSSKASRSRKDSGA